MNKEISQSSLELFRKFIISSSGFNLTRKNDNTLKVSILERIQKKGFKNEVQYYRYLKFHPQREEEFKELIALITINETAFFRDSPQFLALREFVIPKLAGAKQDERLINVWSAGCSTGEEPYSLAIVFFEFLKKNPGWKVEILATDIDLNAVKKAKDGKYSLRSLRLASSDNLHSFFKKSGKDYIICDDIKRAVKFDYFNLAQFPYPAPVCGLWDLIFCRNVIIYFDNEIKAKVLDQFYKSLNHGGFLYLGFSETVKNFNDNFQILSLADCYIYQKPSQGTSSKKNSLIFSLDGMEEKCDLKDTDCLKYYNKALEYFYKENFKSAELACEEALKRCPDYQEAVFLKGQILANLKRFEEAIDVIGRYLKENELRAPAHFLLGIIYQNLGRIDEACEEFKKSIYIDPEFALSSFRLAEIYEKLKDYKKALREFKYALLAFRKIPADEPLEFAGGIKREIFIQSCAKKIEELKSL